MEGDRNRITMHSSSSSAPPKSLLQLPFSIIISPLFFPDGNCDDRSGDRTAMTVPPATDAARDGPSSRTGEKDAPLLLLFPLPPCWDDDDDTEPIKSKKISNGEREMERTMWRLRAIVEFFIIIVLVLSLHSADGLTRDAMVDAVSRDLRVTCDVRYGRGDVSKVDSMVWARYCEIVDDV